MKNKAVLIGAIIGVATLLVIGLSNRLLGGGMMQPTPWMENSLLGKSFLYVSVILLFPALIVGIGFWGCKYTAGEFPPCVIIATIITLIVYALIGSLIGFIINKIKRGYKK